MPQTRLVIPLYFLSDWLIGRNIHWNSFKTFQNIELKIHAMFQALMILNHLLQVDINPFLKIFDEKKKHSRLFHSHLPHCWKGFQTGVWPLLGPVTQCSISMTQTNKTIIPIKLRIINITLQGSLEIPIILHFCSNDHCVSPRRDHKKDWSIAVAFLLSFKSQISTLNGNEWDIGNWHNF